MATIEDVKMSLFSALREIQEAEEKGKEVDIEEVYEWITAYAFLVLFTMCIVQEDNAVLCDEVVCKLELCNSVTAIHKHQRKVPTIPVDIVQVPAKRFVNDLRPF